MADGTIEYLIRLRGGPAAAAEAGAVRKALQGIGNEQVRVSTTARVATKDGNSFSTSLYNISRMARLASYGLSFVTAAGGAFVGLRFDSTLEQNTVAFTHFLGSTQLATEYLDQLYDLAAHTPFEFTPLATAAKQMLAFGFNAKGALDTLTSIGDAVSGLGTGQEGINRIVLAFGQIKSAGVIQGDELRQLQEAGINAYKYLAAAGLIKKGDRANIGKMYIDADAGLKAIVSGMNAEFGGLAEKQGKTFAGQLSTMKDYATRFLGQLSMPLFNKLRNEVFPGINKELTVISGLMKGGAGAGEIVHELDRWAGANGVLEITLRSLWHALQSTFLFFRDVVLPAIGPFAAAALASLVLGLNAFAYSLDLIRAAIGPLMPLVQIFVVYRMGMWLLALGQASSLARLLAMDMGALRIAILGVGASLSLPMAVLIALGALLVVMVTHWDQFRAGAQVAIGAIGSALAAMVSAFKSAINFILRGWNALHFAVPGFHVGPLKFGGFNLGLPQIPLLAQGGVIRSAGSVIVGDAGPEVLDLPEGAAVTPLRGFGGGDIVLKVGGRELARVLRSELLEAQARGT